MKASTARRERRIIRPKTVIRERIMRIIFVREAGLGGVGDTMVGFGCGTGGSGAS